ncbi:MAG: tetratricopeptide repeat protein, partial [Limisphaerales bacterium]
MKSKEKAPPALKLSRGKKWAFALVAFVLLPLLLLAAVEGGLRLAGYGYPTGFFKRIRIGTKDYYVENDKFGLRFFPPELARSPPPIRMEAEKPAGTFRIFVLGESAALGDPRPAYGVARYLEELLQTRYPGGRFEVICGAVTAI